MRTEEEKRAYMREYNKMVRQRARQTGFCMSCLKNKTEPNRLRCTACLKDQNERAKKRYRERIMAQYNKGYSDGMRDALAKVDDFGAEFE